MGTIPYPAFPKERLPKTSLVLFIYSIILLYIAKTVDNLFVAPIFALLGHEYIILINKRKELEKTAYIRPLR